AERVRLATGQAAEHRRLAAEALAPFTSRDEAVQARAALLTVKEGAARLATARAALSDERRQLDDPARAAGREALRQAAGEAARLAADAAAAHHRLDEAARQAELDAKEAATGAAAARALVDRLDSAVALARAALDHAVEANALATVAGGCAPGDDCPVCARPLPAGFQPPSDAEIDRARAAHDSARADLARAKTRFEEADRAAAAARAAAERCGEAERAHRQAVERLEGESERLAGDHRHLEASLAALPPPYRASLGDPDSVDAAVDRLDEALGAARLRQDAAETADRQARDAEAEEKKARARFDDEVRRPCDDARRQGDGLLSALGDLEPLVPGEPPPPPPEPARD